MDFSVLLNYNSIAQSFRGWVKKDTSITQGVYTLVNESTPISGGRADNWQNLQLHHFVVL